MIDILLSTYNGGEYLREQIESIQQQTFPDWRLLIRDDGSTDNTLNTIRDFEKKSAGKIVLLHDNFGNLRSTKSFEKLLQASSAPYIMFCDQDDVWFPDKVEKTFRLMMETEKKESTDCPVAIFTDLSVTDENLQVTAESFVQSQKMFPEAVSEVHRCLAHSVAAGCTMMLNRAAVQKSLPIPFHQTHDHWCISIVSACGTVRYRNEPTMFYRQHGRNSIGSKQINSAYLFRRLISIQAQVRAFVRLKRSFPYPTSSWKWIYYIFYYSWKRLFK